MDEKYELVTDIRRSQGVCSITIIAGTRLVSHDGGNTYRFCGLNALTVLSIAEVSALLKQGVIREAR